MTAQDSATTTQEPHRIALCGAGGFAKTAHLPAIAASSTLVLAAVYSRSLSSAQALVEESKRYSRTSHDLEVFADDAASEDHSFDALLARSDIPTVVFSLPISTQPRLIERALRAGKNVISEKPVAPSLDEAKRLIQLYEREFLPRGQSWIVAEQFSWELSYCRARKWVQEGKLGELRGFSAQVYIQPSRMARNSGWRQIPDYQGGYILDGGVHFVAGLRHILPYPITSVIATASQLQEYLPPCDTLSGILTATPPPSGSSPASPVNGTFTFSFGTESRTARKYTILGSKASLTVDFSRADQHTVTLSTLPTSPHESEPHALTIEFPQRGVDEEFEAFGQALLDGPKSDSWHEVMQRSGPRATLRDLGVIEGALKSSKEGRTVDLVELAGGREWFDIRHP
ncbi:Gfo/Idh/MocA family protein [Sporobolomyces koalae]|uniref:Gfo/Idh/MocA family protein n=1 Tax=Sporobolomyces koalae TaxID=500713 RepID=UPI0031734ED4